MANVHSYNESTVETKNSGVKITKVYLPFPLENRKIKVLCGVGGARGCSWVKATLQLYISFQITLNIPEHVFKISAQVQMQTWNIHCHGMV